MPTIKLIADSGSTKTEWCILKGRKKTIFTTQGLSPYFVNSDEIGAVVNEFVLPLIKDAFVDEIFFYGTGCKIFLPVQPCMWTMIYRVPRKPYVALKRALPAYWAQVLIPVILMEAVL